MGYEQLEFTEAEEQYQLFKVKALRRYLAREQLRRYDAMNAEEREFRNMRIDLGLINRGIDTYDQFARFMFDTDPYIDNMAYADFIHEGSQLARSLNRTLVVEAPATESRIVGKDKFGKDICVNDPVRHVHVMTPEGGTYVRRKQ